MKKTVSLILLWLLSIPAVMACAVCSRNQARGIAAAVGHGTAPTSEWDLLIASVMLALVVWTLYYSLKTLIRPGEKSPAHIKQSILNTF